MEAQTVEEGCSQSNSCPKIDGVGNIVDWHAYSAKDQKALFFGPYHGVPHPIGDKICTIDNIKGGTFHQTAEPPLQNRFLSLRHGPPQSSMGHHKSVGTALIGAGGGLTRGGGGGGGSGGEFGGIGPPGHAPYNV